MDHVRGAPVGSAIVIGGGLLGTSIAWRLAEASVDVTLLEANGLGSGASSASFAWLSASTPSKQSYYQIKVDGMNEYRTIASELGPPRWLHFDGHVEWNAGARGGAQTRGYDGQPVSGAEGSGPEHLRKKVEYLRSVGYTAELLPVRELRHVESDMVAPTGLEEFVYYPQEGYIDPVDAVGAFAHQARGLGVTIMPQTRVVDFVRDGDRIRGVVTGNGDRFLADTVVSCAGSWTSELLQMAHLQVEMAPAVGMVAISSPTAVRLRSVHHNEGLSIRPDGSGRIMMRNHDFDQMVSPEMSPQTLPAFLDDLHKRAVDVLPGLASSRIEAMRIAVRPIPKDGFPLVGRVPGVPGLYLLACHAAVILGPLLGRLAAHEIAFGDVDSRLEDFRPDRVLPSLFGTTSESREL